MIHRFKHIHRGQAGLTLVELLIAIVLVGIVTAGITITIGHLFTWTTRTNNHMIAVRQVQSAGYWVSRDALQANPNQIDYEPENDEFLILGWLDTGGQQHEVVYTIEDGGLKRSYTGPDGAKVTYVAHHIDSDETTFVQDGDVYVFEVTAIVAPNSLLYRQEEERTYQIKPRPDF